MLGAEVSAARPLRVVTLHGPRLLPSPRRQQEGPVASSGVGGVAPGPWGSHLPGAERNDNCRFAQGHVLGNGG